MPMIPLDIPPGVYANGTELDQAGRWRSASLVRWRDGSMRPIDGWRERIASAFAAAPRAMLSWEDNSGDRWIAAASYNTLSAISASNTVYDITPAGLTEGTLDAGLQVGFGAGFYDTGAYNTPRVSTGAFGEATTWSLDNFGQNLVGCSVDDGVLYEWPLTTGSPAAAISGAPTGCLGLIVTEERFLMALGAGGNPRRIQWCDREDNTTWTPLDTNEAGDFELQTTGRIMCGVRTRGQTLILTDVDAHKATYVGAQFAYGFERVGSSCGAISRKAAVDTDMGVFWMGANGFFVYDGSSVTEVPCDVYDHIFTDINTDQISKAWAMSLGQQGEVWWFYPSGGSTEVDRYVAFDLKQRIWMTGAMSRTAGVDRGVFRYPMMTDGADLLEHEVGQAYGGSEVFAETGPISLGVGENIMAVRRMIPDELTQGDVEVTFKTRFHPNDVEREYGPYAMANPTSLRFSGRQILMRVTGARLAQWRAGVMRIEAMQRGSR